jgi:hypothetical protein
MNDAALASAINLWRQAKEAEQEAQFNRRAFEDMIIKLLDIPESLDGTVTHGAVKITGRIERKVDADKLTELADAAGLRDHLVALFRWTPEINKRAWDAADPAITKPLLGAITSKPGRPSFALVKKGKDE